MASLNMSKYSKIVTVVAVSGPQSEQNGKHSGARHTTFKDGHVVVPSNQPSCVGRFSVSMWFTLQDWEMTGEGHTLRDFWPGGIPDVPVWSPNHVLVTIKHARSDTEHDVIGAKIPASYELFSTADGCPPQTSAQGFHFAVIRHA